MNRAMTATVHWHQGNAAATLARHILIAMLPGLAISIWLLGLGSLRNLLLALGTAWLGDCLVRLLRRQRVSAASSDPGIASTAVLLALLLPGNAAWWMPVLASAFAVALAGPALGGHRHALLHPAMAGVLLVLLLASEPLRGSGPTAGIWADVGFLLGGLYLLRARLLPWQVPLSLLPSLLVGLALFDANTRAVFDLTSLASASSSGLLMLLAFFIAPANGSSAITPGGRLVYGALLGGLTATLGMDSMGIASSVLLANFCAPLLDQLFGPTPFAAASEGREDSP